MKCAAVPPQSGALPSWDTAASLARALLCLSSAGMFITPTFGILSLILLKFSKTVLALHLTCNGAGEMASNVRSVKRCSALSLQRIDSTGDSEHHCSHRRGMCDTNTGGLLARWGVFVL